MTIFKLMHAYVVLNNAFCTLRSAFVLKVGEAAAVSNVNSKGFPMNSYHAAELFDLKAVDRSMTKNTCVSRDYKRQYEYMPCMYPPIPTRSMSSDRLLHTQVLE